MIEISLTTTRLTNKLNAAPQIIDAGLREVILAAGEMLAENMRGEVEAIKVTGSLSEPTAQAISVWQTDASRGVDTHIGIKNPTPAQMALDKGRRPGAPRPPSAALIPWLIARGIAKDEADARKKAFVFARAIGRNGTFGKNFVGKTADRHQAEAKAYIRAHLAEVIKRLWGN